MAASQQRKAVLAATSRAVARLFDTGICSSGELLDEINWSLVDVNLTLSNGRSLRSALATRLREDLCSLSMVPPHF